MWVLLYQTDQKNLSFALLRSNFPVRFKHWKMLNFGICLLSRKQYPWLCLHAAIKEHLIKCDRWRDSNINACIIKKGKLLHSCSQLLSVIHIDAINKKRCLKQWEDWNYKCLTYEEKFKNCKCRKTKEQKSLMPLAIIFCQKKNQYFSVLVSTMFQFWKITMFLFIFPYYTQK